jgi:hemerythrin-like domain-containing protein
MTTPATLKILRDEHAALSAVLRSMSLLIAEARRRGTTPDFLALRAMLLYVDEFPEKQHHAKESQLLFPLLRERSDEANAVLEKLDRDHERGEHAIRQLEHLLTAWELLGDTRREPFVRELGRYTDFYLGHMRIEESEVLPLAQRVLSAADWQQLDKAFGEHRDALTGGEPDAVYRKLFQTIVNITPAPIGLG